MVSGSTSEQCLVLGFVGYLDRQMINSGLGRGSSACHAQLYTAYTFRITHVCLKWKMVSTLMSCDIDHMTKSTRLSLHFFCGVKSHSKTLCMKEEEPGNEAKCSQGSKN